MSADQDDSMLSDDDDARPMLSRFTSARGQSIPSTARSEPTKTSTMASSPQLPLTSDVAFAVISTPASAATEKASRLREHILKMRLTAAKQNAQFEREERLRIRRARTGERKQIVVLKADKKELYGRLHKKDTELKQKHGTIAHEQDLRATLSREHDQLARQFEAVKKNLRTGKMALAQQVNEKDREIRMLKAECAKEKARLNEKSREIEKLKADLAEKQGAAAGNPMLQNLMLELQKTQASLMMPAAPPKTAERGVEMGTQTDDDGLAEKVAAMKRILG